MDDLQKPLFAREIIDCLSEGRKPTVRELCSLADWIGPEIVQFESFSVRDDRSPTANRLLAMRASHLALCRAADDASHNGLMQIQPLAANEANGARIGDTAK